MFTNCSFDATKKILIVTSKGCMERFCKDLRDHAIKMNYEEKEMIPLTDKEKSLMRSKKFVTYAKKNLILMKMIKMDYNYTIKSEFIVITLENLEELLIVSAI